MTKAKFFLSTTVAGLTENMMAFVNDDRISLLSAENDDKGEMYATFASNTFNGLEQLCQRFLGSANIALITNEYGETLSADERRLRRSFSQSVSQ